ncbi:MAG TPA: hypothetical protein VFY36_00365 [Solirubrobacteraceae bacterium]|nr:hypothetical protein [Solirubrobacteraceae bacterium]
MTSETLSIREVQRNASGNRDELLLALCEELTSQVGNAMRISYRAEGAWVDGVRAALYELLAFLDASPTLARLLIVGSGAVNTGVLAQRGRVLDMLACALEADSPSAAIGSLPAPFGADAVVAAVASVLHARLADESAPLLRELRGPLMAVIVLSYLGADAARDELLRSPPPREGGCELDRMLQ